MKRLPSSLLAALLLAGLPLLAAADQASRNGNGGTVSADLEFFIDIGKVLFFRVGSGSSTSVGTVDTVALNPALVIPPGAVTAATGNNISVNWTGVIPTFNTPTVSLPVEVISNAGQVSIRASATLPLTSGANNIPLSQILVSSSDPGLPAPLIPDTGTGTAVNVAGTNWSNLVTQRTATWTFSYSPAAITQSAGQYNGQVTFTASSP